MRQDTGTARGEGYLKLQGVNLVVVSLSGGPPAGASIF